MRSFMLGRACISLSAFYLENAERAMDDLYSVLPTQG